MDSTTRSMWYGIHSGICREIAFGQDSRSCCLFVRLEDDGDDGDDGAVAGLNRSILGVISDTIEVKNFQGMLNDINLSLPSPACGWLTKES
jgi:hypothetical protein